jgi:hypothetical protein
MGGWHSARREIAVAGGLVIALTAALWILYGSVTASIVALSCCAIALAALRPLIGPHQRPESPPEPYYDTPSSSFAGFWRTQTDLADAMASMSAWDLTTRHRLQNLLAARLAEHHGISLAEDPQAARAAFIGAGPGRDGVSKAAVELWYWIDPERPTPADAASRKGIPPRVLAALIHRLEQL